MKGGESIVETALAGFGLCQMPASIVRGSIEQGLLASVLTDYSPQVDVHLLWMREATLAPRIRYVIDQLVEHAQRGELD